MKSTLFLCTLAVVLISMVGVARGWGVEGHQVIVDIAQTMLSSQSQAAVKKYIPGQTMDQVSSVPDEYDHTPQGSWSEPLHYVNMNRGQQNFSMAIDCNVQPGCVVSAIQNYTKILSDQYTSGKHSGNDEPNAFIFLIHFVGDSHQPLHVGYTDDLGGNTVKVSFFGQNTELHRVWDENMIVKYNSDTTSLTKELVSIINNNQTLIKIYTQDMDPTVWADESFYYTRTTVYQGVTGHYPSLGDDYYNLNMPIVKERLIAAGIRLAALLNSIFQ